MKNLHPPLCRAVLHLALSAALLSAGAAAGAQGQHAHTHGRLSIDVAVDAGSITILDQVPEEDQTKDYPPFPGSPAADGGS